jgi:AcrR family transcriptional regulator
MLDNVNADDPRVQRTRQVLQEALIELLSERDFQKITVQDIARRAGVNRATFYTHFVDKQALVNYMVQERFQTALDEKMPATAALTAPNLRQLTLVVCDYMAHLFGHCAPSERYTSRSLVASQVQVRLHDVLKKWINQSDNTSVTAAEITAMALSWTIYGAAYQWVQEGQKISAQELADHLLPLLTDGVQLQQETAA